MTYIFIRDNPTRVSGTSKFFILHELGHADVFSLYAGIRWLNGCYTMAGLILWLLVTMTFDVFRVLGALVVIATALWVRARWDLGAEVPNLHSEVQADAFALDLLMPEDRASLERFLQKHRMPSDPRLNDVRNLRRDELLREALSYVRVGHQVDGMSDGMAMPSVLVSGSFCILLLALGFLWPQTQSLIRATITSGLMLLFAFLLAGWSIGASKYRFAEVTTEINRRLGRSGNN